MWLLELVGLDSLMARTRGRPEVKVGLIDGPVSVGHPDLARGNIREVKGKGTAACSVASSAACQHGTLVAGVLHAKRGTAAPAICPNCTLLVRPIFPETPSRNGTMPSATPEELAAAVMETVDAGAWVLNLSSALMQVTTHGECQLTEALDYAARRGVIVVVAAGNQATVGGTVLTRHPWVIPVVACGTQGRPTAESNLGSSIGRRGLMAPGENITSLGTDNQPRSFGGTSAASPFVTGAIALLWSEFPGAKAAEVKQALNQASPERRKSVLPPLLHAERAYQLLEAIAGRRSA
jgi:subtilisin family serine protease